MFVDWIIALFPTVELHVAEVAFAVVLGVGLWLVEEASARELCISIRTQRIGLTVAITTHIVWKRVVVWP